MSCIDAKFCYTRCRGDIRRVARTVPVNPGLPTLDHDSAARSISDQRSRRAKSSLAVPDYFWISLYFWIAFSRVERKDSEMFHSASKILLVVGLLVVMTDFASARALSGKASSNNLPSSTGETDLPFFAMDECRQGNLKCRKECQSRGWRTGFCSEIFHCHCVA